METSGLVLEDFRFAIRTFAKAPGFPVTVIAALALGIGASTAIFSLANSILIRPLPYPESSRIMVVWDSNIKRTWDTAPAAYGNFEDWRRGQTTFETIAATRGAAFHLTGGDEPERISGGLVSEGFFRVFGVQPFLGRDFQPEEFVRGRERVVILSHGLWLRRFGGSREVIGKPLRINEADYLVVGVMPDGFHTPSKHEIWAPLALTPEAATSRDRHMYLVYGRLRRGVTVGQAQRELAEIARQAERAYPETNAGFSVVVRPLREEMVGSLRSALMVLMAAVGVVLLVACSNVANLQLSRASAREKEIGIRAALGATAGRILRQMLAESVVLAGAGGAVGLLLAYVLLRAIIQTEAAASIPRVTETDIDLRVLLFTLLVSVGSGVLSGLAPGFYAARLNLSAALKQGGRSGSGGGSRLRNVLVVAEIALAVVLLSMAGVFVRSFLQISSVDPGFRPEGVLLAESSLPRSRYADPVRQEWTYRRMIERLSTLPGVRAAAGATTVPFGKADLVFTYYAASRPKPDASEMPAANYYGVTPDYFRALGIPLRRGRVFTERDGEGESRVVIVNETLARKTWPGEDPVGQYLVVEHEDRTPRQVIGVVGDIKHYGLDEESTAEVYEPIRQHPLPYLTFVLRSDVKPEALATTAAKVVREIEPDLAVYNVRTMQHQIEDSILSRRVAVTLVTAFAGLALLLAALGTYGVVSYSVTRRTQEFGVRMALGATPGDIFALVLKQGMSFAVSGVVAGLAISMVSGRAIASQLYRVSPVDPVVSLLVVGVLLAAALLACLHPARRAINVEPVAALRYE